MGPQEHCSLGRLKGPVLRREGPAPSPPWQPVHSEKQGGVSRQQALGLVKG